MKNATIGHKLRILVTLASTLVLSAAASAHGGGGGGGGGHGGGGHGGSFGGHGGGHMGFAGRGGYGGYGGWRGGYGGWRGGYGGWRGGYGGWGWGGWGWGALGLGLYFSALPWYYDTLWWDGVPYYYADGNYYQWDDSASAYETVNPPPEVAKQVAAGQGTPSDVIVYPKNGQTADQQAKDRQECRTWAAGQINSAGAPSAAKSAAAANNRDYLRAQAACLQGRGYSVQ